MKKLKPTISKLPAQNSRLLVPTPIINQTPMQSPIEANPVNYLESIVNSNIDNQVRMSNTRNPLFADDTMLSEGALSEINRLNQAQIPMTQPTIDEKDDTGVGGIGIGQALAQSLAMLGAGVRGGDVGQVGRMFDLNRQEAFRQGQYQKQKAEQKQKIKEQENTARQYVDPNSEISIQERAKAEELYPFLIPKNLSYADINNNKVMEALKAKYNATQEQKLLEEQKGLQSRLDDPNSPESIKLRNDLNLLRINVPKGLSANQMEKYYGRLVELSKPQPMIGGGGVRGGVGQGKPEKEVKSDKKSLAEYKEHVSALTEMSGVIDNIKKLGRTRIGGITPDFSTDTQAISSSLDRAAQPMIKTLAGPGTLQKEERDTYSKLVPTGNTRSDLALRQANDIILDGTKISLNKMNTDLSVGNLNRQDYDSLINQYNEQLTKKGIGVNQVINPSTGQLEPRQRKEAELKDGRKVIIDQFGYTWE